MTTLARRPHFTCGNCEFARERRAATHDAGRAASGQVGLHLSLSCLRNPFEIYKATSESCGEHSELVAERRKEHAEMMASAVIRALRPS